MDPIVRRLFENRSIHEDADSPDEQYRNYLTEHREGVKNCYYDVLLPVLEAEDTDEETLKEIEETIEAHDASKDDPVEFNAYRDYFYDPEGHPRSSEAFNLAWLHHQNHNPHHWQYWCLINDVDEPQVQPMDMPFKYIIEMLCDWQSAGAHYGNTAKQWYDKQQDRMKLSDNTKKLVEKYLEFLG